MPGALIALVAAGLGWAWWTGRLKGFGFEDAAAAALFLLGARLATTGKLVPGLALMAGAGIWLLRRRAGRRRRAMPPEDARRLLGVGADASLDEIRAAHRRLIARVHPDAGGSAELAHRVNVARDILVAEHDARAPRLS